MSEGRRISTIYSILCKWRNEGRGCGPGKKGTGTAGVAEDSEGRKGDPRINERAGVDQSRSFFHLRILISRWKKGASERARPIRREKAGNRESAVIQFTNVSLELQLCLDTQTDLPSVSLSSSSALEPLLLQDILSLRRAAKRRT